MRNIIVILAVFTLVTPGMARGDSNVVTVDGTGSASLSCQCIAATSGCPSKLFHELAGSPTQTWTEKISVKQGMQIDLSELCYRKRDVAGMGDGLCCSIAGGKDENIRFYWGDLGPVAP